MQGLHKSFSRSSYDCYHLPTLHLTPLTPGRKFFDLDGIIITYYTYYTYIYAYDVAAYLSFISTNNLQYFTRKPVQIIQ